jgi:hypothetical protein
VEEVEQQPFTIMRCDVGALALLANQDAVLDQLVDRLAQGADGDAELMASCRSEGISCPGFSSPDASCSISARCTPL